MIRRRKTEIVQVNLRLREEFRQRLVRAAEKSGLSFNQEMVHRLEQSFEHDEREDLKAELKTTIREEIRKERSDALVRTLREEYRDHFAPGFYPPPHSLPPQDRVTNKPKDKK
jgi:hypothetical protein